MHTYLSEVGKLSWAGHVTRVYGKRLLNGAFCSNSWEDINPKINCSQMLHSARILENLQTNVLCCLQTRCTNTVQKLQFGSVN